LRCVGGAGEIGAGVGAGKSAKTGVQFAEETVAFNPDFVPCGYPSPEIDSYLMGKANE
jgi:hypothetical protein